MNERRTAPLATALTLALVFASVATVQAVTITEIMYNPAGSTAEGAPNLEFIEIVNEEPEALDLLGYTFCGGLEFTFEERRFLDPGEYLVIASDADAVRAAYGIENVVGSFGGAGDEGSALDNGGERIRLCDNAGVVRASVRYNDRGKWPGAADGLGYSLELESIYREQDDPDNWTVSVAPGGTPGAARGTAAERTIVLNELFSLTTGDEDRFVELYNRTDAAVDISGYGLSVERSDLGQFRFAEGTVIEAGGFLAITETMFGEGRLTVAESGERLFVVLSSGGDEPMVVDARTFRPRTEGLSEARIGDGSKLFSEFATPTPGAANEVDVEDSIVINEIHYHPIDEDEEKEFIEIVNTGEAAVDLTGWRFAQGVDFTFPAVELAAGAYLVIARSPEVIRELYELPTELVVGPETDEARDDYGRLADGGERVTLEDAVGNIADTVRYHDGGEWSGWADGGGSTLELIDANQWNESGQAWDASDDSDRAPVTEIDYSGRFVAGEPELHYVLPGRGITVIDDVEMTTRIITVEIDQPFVANEDNWRLFKGTEAPPADWATPEFDDASWIDAAPIIGYGEEDETTVLEDMRGNYLSIFLRRTFTLAQADIDAINDLIAEVEYDDGFAAYLNGELLAAVNLRENPPSWETRARGSRERAVELLDLTERIDLLREGTNTFAVSIHNSTVNSNDARFRASLSNGRFVPMDGDNLVVNGTFESPDLGGAYLIQGTHVYSGVTAENPITGDGSLKIISTGNGDNKVNRIETSNRGLARLDPGEYVVKLKARWVVGVPTLLTHGHYQGNSQPNYAGSHQLLLPPNFGTPGARNTASIRHEARTASTNQGPVFSKVRHSPALPGPGEAVTVSARPHDSDGIRSVELHYSTDRPFETSSPESTTVAMTDADGDGVYTAEIPGAELRTLRVFHVTATDDRGATGRFPLDRLDRVHAPRVSPDEASVNDDRHVVYMHDNPYNGPYLSYRAFIHKGLEDELTRRALHSNNIVDATFIFGDEDPYYGAGVRFSGSPFARGGWQESWRVRMPDDAPLFGRIKKFGMEDHQGAGARDGRERISHYMIRFNQGTTPVPYSTQWLTQFQVNARLNQPREHYNLPSRQFLEQWYPDDHKGLFLEMDDRHTMSDSGQRQSSTDGRILYPPYGPRTLGADKEQYRYYFNPRGWQPIRRVGFVHRVLSRHDSEHAAARRV